MLSELDLIRRIREQVLPGDSCLRKGIGDDCAAFVPRDGATMTLVTTDTLVEGVHFDLAWHPPELLGRKALAVNVSDVAAMGGVSRYALLSLAVPSGVEPERLDAFMQGFLGGLARYQMTLIGGDTVKSDQGWVLSITVLGEVDQGQVVYRSGARSGDQVWVSGPLGQAAAGLELCRRGLHTAPATPAELVKAHLDPLPETALGPMLAASGLVSAMIDLSDGLASDLAHICEESGVAAEVAAEALPNSEATRQVARECDLDAVRLAIAGGEDYRLLFTAPPSATKGIQALAHHAVGGQLFRVGEIVEGQGVCLVDKGQSALIDFQGYDHFR